eukprot:COSAG01_NODE_29097_length_645_cov_1.250916_1_plen_94_part_10
MSYIEYLGVQGIQYGADAQDCVFRLHARIVAVQGRDGVRTYQYELSANDRDADHYMKSPITIEPWATQICVDQSQDASNDLAPIRFPSLFRPVY